MQSSKPLFIMSSYYDKSWQFYAEFVHWSIAKKALTTMGIFSMLEILSFLHEISLGHAMQKN